MGSYFVVGDIHGKVNYWPLMNEKFNLTIDVVRPQVDPTWSFMTIDDHANVHRGTHTLAQRATAAYETARQKTAAFINAKQCLLNYMIS